MSETVELLRSIRDAIRHMADISEAVSKRSLQVPPSSRSGIYKKVPPTSKKGDFRPVFGYEGRYRTYPPPMVIPPTQIGTNAVSPSGQIGSKSNLPVPYNRPISHPPALSGGTNVPAIRNIFSIARQQSDGGDQPDWGEPLKLGYSKTNLATAGNPQVPSMMGGSVGEWRQKVNIGGKGGGGMDCCDKILQKMDEIIAILRESSATPDTSTEIGIANNQLNILMQKQAAPRKPKEPKKFTIPEGIKIGMAEAATGAAFGLYDWATDVGHKLAKTSFWKWWVRNVHGLK